MRLCQGFVFTQNFPLKYYSKNGKMKRASDADDRSDNKRQEIKYNTTYEKIICRKVALRKLISDNEWVCKLRNAVSTMTQMRVHGTRTFSDYILHAVINRGDTITTSDQLTTIVRACYIVNTNDESRGRKLAFFNDPINKE